MHSLDDPAATTLRLDKIVAASQPIPRPPRPTLLGTSACFLVAALFALFVVVALMFTDAGAPWWMPGTAVGVSIAAALVFIVATGRHYIDWRIGQEGESAKADRAEMRAMLLAVQIEQQQLCQRIIDVQATVLAAVEDLAADIGRYGERRSSEATIAALVHVSGGVNARGAQVRPLTYIRGGREG